MMEDKRERLSWLILLLLLIIIIILLFFIRFGRIEEKYLIPTGNVDVFNIDVNCKCPSNNNCDNKSKGDVKGDDTYDSTDYTIPIYDEDEDEEVIGEVFVDDKNGNFIYQQNLQIFNNSAYKYTNKIAPGVSNSYYFIVHNNTNKNVNYRLDFYEISEYKINLKYRLKKNNEYVVGNDSTWVTAEQLKTDMSNIVIEGSDKYYLDWKWFDDDANDTIAGKNMTSEYKLNIRIYFETV